MTKNRNWVWAAAMLAGLAAAAPADAAVAKASFGVATRVVASCRIVAGQAKACAPSAAPTAAPAPQPTVSFARDPKTGFVTETVEF